MYQSRIHALLKTEINDAFLITSPENLYYFSGFTGGEGALFIDKDTRKLFTDSRYTVQAEEESPDFEIIDVAQTPLSSFLQTVEKKSIGFEDEAMSVSTMLALKKAVPTLALMPASRHIEGIRVVKDAAELSLIAKAAKLSDDAFSYILPKISPGKTEKEIALDLEFFMRKNGADGVSFEIVAVSGYRSAMPHGVATEKVIQNGEFLTLDFGCKYKGYCSDMTRTVVVGKASERQKEIYETVLSAQLAALKEIRAGKACCEIDAVARNIIKDAGYGDCFGHGLGHSVGLKIHEKPSLSPRSEEILMPNITMTVEPGIYIKDFGGVRIEDLVVVTENGYQNLVGAPKELIETGK